MDVVDAAVVECAPAKCTLTEGVPAVLGGGAHVAGRTPGVVTHQHLGHKHGADRRGVPGEVVGVAGVPGKVTAWGWGERRGERGRQRRGEKGRVEEERQRWR